MPVIGDDDDVLLRAVARAPIAAPGSVPAVAFSGDSVRIGPEVEVPPGTRIGRFTIAGLLGAGGMGVVYDAIDETLGRRVALKLVRAAGAGEDASARLLREAQALARLSHPNVVTVFEAGRDGDRVHVAMERVSGATARAWRAAASRTVAQILDVYRQAAAGLAAAHACGLVHRDVKPENILVGDDGRVRVTDFGLVAALGGPATAGPPAGAPADAPADVLALTLTRTGAALGTPGYMPPEAYLRGQGDARGDQWSLCVCVWEALAGERPFAGATHAALAEAVCAGRIERGRERVPARLRPVLERGLAVDPAARWPSLDALVAALARPPRPAARRATLAVAAVAAIGGGALAVRAIGDRGDRHETMASEPVPLTEPGGCPYMPIFADDDTIVFDDGNGDLEVVRGGDAAVPLLADPTRNDWRATRGRRAGEVIFVASGASGSRAGFLDLATGAVETAPLGSASFAVGGDALFYARTDVPEVRRVRGGEDAPVTTLPSGRWPYTVAASADGARLAITTATDRSTPSICLVDRDPASDRVRGPVTCLERDDVILGRAAFAPAGDVLYYQTRAGIRRRARTGDDRLWLPGAYAYGGLDVAPGGGALLFSDARPLGTEAAPIDAPEQVVVRSQGAPVFAAGRWFYPRQREDGGLELVSQAADGSVRVLAPPLGPLGNVDVDRGGGHVTVDVDGAEPGIYLIDTRPFPPVRLTRSRADSNPVFLRDGRIAFTRWDERMNPSVIVIDPDDGSRDDQARRPAHPAPRVTAALVPTTGELVLVDVDNTRLYAWDPATGRERSLDVDALGGRDVLQAAASPDGQWLAVLTGQHLWRVSLAGGPAAKLLDQPPCSTLDKPAFDDAGRLHVVRSRWRGDVYRVALD